jgi:hypothetical protein
MSIADEHDLRRQLGGVLDAIMPPEAPVSAAARKGKLIQAGRSLGIVAGVAVVAGIGVGTPSLLNQAAREVSHARSTVMVEQICTTAPHGILGAAGRPELVAVRPKQSPAVESSGGGLPAAELAAGDCAWLKP